MSCPHSLPPASAKAHCSVCCSTFSSVVLFDAHRKDGECYDLEGVYELDGVWSTSEGHAKLAELTRRFKKKA